MGTRLPPFGLLSDAFSVTGGGVFILAALGFVDAQFAKNEIKVAAIIIKNKAEVIFIFAPLSANVSTFYNIRPSAFYFQACFELK